MSFEENLIHTCRIRKDTDAGTEDDEGNPDLSRAVTRSEIPCLYIVKDRRLLTDEIAGAGVAQIYFLYVMPSQDIAEGYLVDQITYEEGTPVSESFKVEKVFPRRAGLEGAHHIRALLERLG